MSGWGRPIGISALKTTSIPDRAPGSFVPINFVFASNRDLGIWQASSL
jgi:hypothetical protein